MHTPAPTFPYDSGMEYPAKGTIFAPFSTWKSYRRVFASPSDAVLEVVWNPRHRHRTLLLSGIRNL